MRKPGSWKCLMVIGFLMIGMTACSFDQDRHPTIPQENLQRDGMSYSNFYAGRGYDDEYRTYIGNEVFVIQVPAGEYLLRYDTTSSGGPFDIVFHAADRALLYVGLREGEMVNNAYIYNGIIIDPSYPSQLHGDVTLYCWPGSQTTWSDVFRSYNRRNQKGGR